MKIFLFIVLASIFCFINYKIIISDFKRKKIPNKNLLELLILLPFWWIFLYFYYPNEINILSFFIQIFVSFLISFGLFTLGIWRAGDAKYLLILSLFIPYIGIIPFIGNIGIFTLFYLFLFFFWFFIGKGFVIKGHFKALFNSIKTDLTAKWQNYKLKKGGKNVVLKWLVGFLIIFVSIRLARIYLIASFLEKTSNGNFLEIFEKYHFYLIFAIILITIFAFYIIKKFIYIIKKFISKKLNLNPNFIGNILLIILFLALVSFIIYEYFKNPSEISTYLIRIFTIYIFLYIFFKIVFYSYKISFVGNEEKIIDIDLLKVGDVVEKNYLHQMFSEQKCLGSKKYLAELANKKVKSPSYYIQIEPENYFRKINNPIDLKTKNMLQKIYKIVEKDRLKDPIKKANFEKNENIKIINTFSFGIYIFIGFLVTFILKNKIIIGIILIIKKIFIG